MFLRLIRIELSSDDTAFRLFYFSKITPRKTCHSTTSVPAFAATFQLIDLLLTTVRRTFRFFTWTDIISFSPSFYFIIFMFIVYDSSEKSPAATRSAAKSLNSRTSTQTAAYSLSIFTTACVIIARGRYNNIHLQFLRLHGAHNVRAADKNISSLPIGV